MGLSPSCLVNMISATIKNYNIKNNHQMSMLMKKPCTFLKSSLINVPVCDGLIRFCLCKHPFLHFINSFSQYAECRGNSPLLQQGQEPTPQQADQIHHRTAKLGSVKSHLCDSLYYWSTHFQKYTIFQITCLLDCAAFFSSSTRTRVRYWSRRGVRGKSWYD